MVFGHGSFSSEPRNPPRPGRVNQASQEQTGISEPTTRVNERELIAAAVAGEVTAQRMLYDQHVDRVYRPAYRLAGRTSSRAISAGDVHRRSSGSRTSRRVVVRDLIHTIAMSVSLNGLRKVKKFRTRESPLDDALTVGTVTRRAEPDLKERLRQAIDNLPEGYRTVFVMHDVEGYTHEEIAAALGVQPGTSKAQLFRARAKLREALADFAGEWVS